MIAAKILVFDSGLGGLSILKALQNELPDCHYTYASDNHAFPYGTKTDDFLIQRIQKVLSALIQHSTPDLLVVACNTASTLVLPHIRRLFDIPIVGVVPAIKPASTQTQSFVIGLLGTPSTVKRTYTDELISKFADNCQVIRIGSSELVIQAENALYGLPPCKKILGNILKPLFENMQLDTIVLACTHFPLIKNTLIAYAPRQVTWLDSGQAVARHVSTLLEHKTTFQQAPGYATILFTAKTNGSDLLKKNLEKFNINHIDYLII